MLATAKLYTNGKGQTTRLKKEDSAWKIFDESEPVTDDFCENIIEARQNTAEPKRDAL